MAKGNRMNCCCGDGRICPSHGDTTPELRKPTPKEESLEILLKVSTNDRPDIDGYISDLMLELETELQNADEYPCICHIQEWCNHCSRWSAAMNKHKKRLKIAFIETANLLK